MQLAGWVFDSDVFGPGLSPLSVGDVDPSTTPTVSCIVTQSLAPIFSWVGVFFFCCVESMRDPEISLVAVFSATKWNGFLFKRIPLTPLHRQPFLIRPPQLFRRCWFFVDTALARSIIFIFFHHGITWLG